VKAVSTGVKDNSRSARTRCEDDLFRCVIATALCCGVRLARRYDAEREYWRQRKVQAKVDKAARKEHIKANAKKLIRQ